MCSERVGSHVVIVSPLGSSAHRHERIVLLTIGG